MAGIAGLVFGPKFKTRKRYQKKGDIERYAMLRNLKYAQNKLLQGFSGNRSLLVCTFHVNAPAHAVNRIVAEPILNPETGPILSPETGPVLSPDFGPIYRKAGPKSSPDSGPRIEPGFRPP